ncbi:hypothetical protein [uncultured Pelagimonas sp.]|uniref:hypothetical protein n=1 Tax=uncultured Pelagimonas sp. TaxID=1618102 RepID=UPI00261C0E19|nr:hypothetical protein [uncultured Pelagimonas sp.]
MLQKLTKENSTVPARSVFLTCSGFETRAISAAKKFAEFGTQFDKSILATYNDPKNSSAELAFQPILRGLTEHPQASCVVPLEGATSFRKRLKAELTDVDHVYCDITGFNTPAMFEALSGIMDSGKSMNVVYTEASEYSPSRQEFEEFFCEGREEDLFSVEEYEMSSFAYSKACEVDFISGFEGVVSPGYPYFLIAFLPFKRSRLGAVLQQIEASRRLLISGDPVRTDLKWRAWALEKINQDILDHNASQHKKLSTLDLKQTLDFLEETIRNMSIQYRYNIVVAPLGSKIQKVACWLFGCRNPRVSVLQSNPVEVFADSYSHGAQDTFISSDLRALFKGDF